MKGFSESFWSDRYKDGTTGWNIGYPSTPIVEYANQLSDKDIKVLIPGAGNAYEAEYLATHGFSNVYVLDISSIPLENLRSRCPAFPPENLIHSDFFRHEGRYDLILEQTFFCALHPGQRRDYADTAFELLRPGGKLAGLWFDFPLDPEQESPPFGGSGNEYMKYFEQFNVITLQPCYNSIKPREGKELFGIFQKPRSATS